MGKKHCEANMNENFVPTGFVPRVRTLEQENQRLRELVEQLQADLKTALKAYRDVVSKL
jgi:hypothetical protein